MLSSRTPLLPLTLFLRSLSPQVDGVAKSDFDQRDIGISIGNFLDHIVTSGLCSKECYVIALIYGERMLQLDDGFRITRRNVHRLMLVSLLLASKMLDDFYCRNMYYATAGGITLEALNALELKMCFMMVRCPAFCCPSSTFLPPFF